MNQPSPAIVTQGAVRRLPRAALFLLCAAYVVLGFVGREPWKNADITAFGYMLEIASGRSSWTQPTLLGQRPEFDALLPYWLGAAAIELTAGWLAPDFAARIPFIGLLALTFLGTWYGIYHLAREPEAQPVAFAFGGEARPIDYARAIADGGLLALVATLGLAQLSHETTPAAAQLGFGALAFYGIAALRLRPWAALGLAIGLAGLALSGAATLAAAFAAIAVGSTALDASRSIALQTDPAPKQLDRRALALALACVVPVLVMSFAFDLWRWRIQPWSTLDPASFSRLLLWFTWPAWPLALWTVWRWRRQWTDRHLTVPLGFAGVIVAAAFWTAVPDRTLLLALPALSALAAFALPTLRRSVSAVIDWFTLLFFSGFGLVIWAVWISLQTGVPAKPAANVARLAPDYVPSFGWIPFLAAIMSTAVWAWLVKWRAGRHPAAIWKSLVLPAGGAALCWVLLTTLWLPALNFARSHAAMVSSIAPRMSDDSGCVAQFGLNRGQLVAFRFHGGLDLRNAPDGADCRWLLAPMNLSPTAVIAIEAEGWREVRGIRRPVDTRDGALLFQKAGR